MLYKIVKYVQLFSLVLWFICFFHASISIQLRHLHFHFICLPLYRCFVTHDYLYTNTSFFSVFPFFRFSVFPFFRFSVFPFYVLRFTCYVFPFPLMLMHMLMHMLYAHAHPHSKTKHQRKRQRQRHLHRHLFTLRFFVFYPL